MITTMVFDIGGVFFHQLEKATHNFREILGLKDHSLIDHEMYGTGLWEKYKRGIMTEEEYWTTLIKQLEAPYEGNWSSLCREFDQGIHLDTELVEVARELKKNYAIHALSNAGAELERRLEQYGIHDLFDHVINSHRVLLAKPDREIYTLTSLRINASPEEILFVDDKPRNTIVAEAMGWNTHVYTNASAFQDFLRESELTFRTPIF